VVGGKIIEMRPMTIMAGDYPGKPTYVIRLWCVSTKNADEAAVYARLEDVMPQVGDEIWWQAGHIYFDGDKRSLRKVAYSFDPRPK